MRRVSHQTKCSAKVEVFRAHPAQPESETIGNNSSATTGFVQTNRLVPLSPTENKRCRTHLCVLDQSIERPSEPSASLTFSEVRRLVLLTQGRSGSCSWCRSCFRIADNTLVGNRVTLTLALGQRCFEFDMTKKPLALSYSMLRRQEQPLPRRRPGKDMLDA